MRGLLLTILLVSSVMAAPVPKPGRPRFDENNSNALITQYKNQLTVEASSKWDGWPVEHLIDGNDETSWYSNNPDNTIQGTFPVITVTFPEAVKVKRVTILGNRDPKFPNGYFVMEGTFELLNKEGKVLSKYLLKSQGEKHDFDLMLKNYEYIHAIRFTMTKSEQGHAGIGEVMVE